MSKRWPDEFYVDLAEEPGPEELPAQDQPPSPVGLIRLSSATAEWLHGQNALQFCEDCSDRHTDFYHHRCFIFHPNFHTDLGKKRLAQLWSGEIVGLQ